MLHHEVVFPLTQPSGTQPTASTSCVTVSLPCASVTVARLVARSMRGRKGRLCGSDYQWNTLSQTLAYTLSLGSNSFLLSLCALGELNLFRVQAWANRRCVLNLFNPLTPNDHYSGRTALLTSKRLILYIYSTNIGTEYFKRGIYSPCFSLQNAVCFIILMYLVPVLFTFYIFIQQI